MTVQIKLRRDTAANWTAVNPTLAMGEPGLETDTLKIKYGDGTNPWVLLPYPSNLVTTVGASNLTGTTLAGNVYSSSLTTVGTLVNLTVTNPIFGSVTGSAGSAALATSIGLGSANQILYQTSANTTGFLPVPSSANTYLQWTGSAFTWSNSASVAQAPQLSGTYIASNVVGSSLTSVGVLTGLTSSGAVSITNNTAATTYQTGALVVGGGVGITGNTYIHGNLVVDGSITGANGETITGNLSVSGSATVGNISTKAFSVAMATALS
jgi:hypothetical protein